MDSIIFDVDGTLWNSTGIVAKAWENYLRNVEQIELPLTAEIMLLCSDSRFRILQSRFFQMPPEKNSSV